MEVGDQCPAVFVQRHVCRRLAIRADGSRPEARRERFRRDDLGVDNRPGRWLGARFLQVRLQRPPVCKHAWPFLRLSPVESHVGAVGVAVVGAVPDDRIAGLERVGRPAETSQGGRVHAFDGVLNGFTVLVRHVDDQVHMGHFPQVLGYDSRLGLRVVAIQTGMGVMRRRAGGKDQPENTGREGN